MTPASVLNGVRAASHVSHWLHVDLPDSLAGLGYPMTTVTSTH
jgi:hypothetical protein